MNNKQGLKPCPFCANSATMNGVRIDNVNIESWIVKCNNCGCHSPKDSSSQEGAKKIWNRRRYVDRNLLFLTEYDKILLSDRAKNKGMSFKEYMQYIVNKSLTLTEDKV